METESKRITEERTRKQKTQRENMENDHKTKQGNIDKWTQRNIEDAMDINRQWVNDIVGIDSKWVIGESED